VIAVNVNRLYAVAVIVVDDRHTSNKLYATVFRDLKLEQTCTKSIAKPYGSIRKDQLTNGYNVLGNKGVGRI